MTIQRAFRCWVAKGRKRPKKKKKTKTKRSLKNTKSRVVGDVKKSTTRAANARRERIIT
jgi:hypothetical protein